MLRGLLLEERLLAEVLGERVQRPRSGEREIGAARLQLVVLLAVVRDVLADPLLAAPWRWTTVVLRRKSSRAWSSSPSSS